MSNRKKVPPKTQTKILSQSRRRCSLCFGLNADLSEKSGQIAHLDHNRSNNAEDNLVFLCLNHHDRYDSRTSQSKGLTEGEIKEYRMKLYKAVETGINITAKSDQNHSEDQRNHDIQNFKLANDLMSEDELKLFLSHLQSNDLYTRESLHPFESFCSYFKKVGNYYVIDEVANLTKELLRSMEALDDFITCNFFPYHDFESYCLYPDLNVDRAGNGSYEDMDKYQGFQRQLDTLCNDVRNAYKAYRLVIKKNLLM